ncbi:50S ribosomal protein L32 [Bombilactobacillus mellis]|uniref:Large ribosomal subunit protein bL32 n=1 Tax=Bombilactobacillus mellis TaxID=1218508 RepID=A0A0F4KR93_9LACO|nr:50S ribosomal protein L32 [Bombilactobacillus mellis]MBI0107270.1 50S ribosomal protein L32 [Lactobacillus sp. W8086]MBI0108735.1 50S ribosomal protein L32 [Lactobacillus sp. W8085]MBI0111952.1 50S ribosomal protein L32 [Lactobacillus sp. W8088]MBI0115668.1 50S ribosomal protein L32 [Lactobacillus sp. W8087]MBI0119392.1 50S ribosomal protein L32 [Lactobacillus sp. W8089]MBI0131358.1 50S ribosomal protein L32 [Lactobacillus sp. W8090]
MAVPARKTSKQKKRQRRGHIKLSQPNIQFDVTTGEYRMNHHVSPKGYYKGRQVVKANQGNN